MAQTWVVSFEADQWIWTSTSNVSRSLILIQHQQTNNLSRLLGQTHQSLNPRYHSQSLLVLAHRQRSTCLLLRDRHLHQAEGMLMRHYLAPGGLQRDLTVLNLISAVRVKGKSLPTIQLWTSIHSSRLSDQLKTKVDEDHTIMLTISSSLVCCLNMNFRNLIA